MEDSPSKVNPNQIVEQKYRELRNKFTELEIVLQIFHSLLIETEK